MQRDNHTYFFTGKGKKPEYNQIKGVSVDKMFSVYIDINGNSSYFIEASADNENDLVLFTLFNPKLKLYKKEKYTIYIDEYGFN